MSGFDGSDDAMDALFADMRDKAAVPSPELLARILADADAEMPVRRAVVSVPSARPVAARTGGRLRSLLSALGGWGGVGGLATATVAGVWIGFADLGAGLGVTTLIGVGATDTATTVELMPGADAFAATAAVGG